MKGFVLFSIAAFTTLCLKAQCPGTVGLIARWDFNGNAIDVSGNGHNGVLGTGSEAPVLTTDSCGNPNSAYLFSRSEDTYIRVPNSPALNLSSTDFTMSFWIYEPNTTTRGGNVIIKRTGFGLTDGYFAGTNTTTHKVNFTIAGGNPGAFNLFSNSAVNSLMWTHVVITYSYLNNRMRMYINGLQDIEASSVPSPTATTSPLHFGRDFESSTAPKFNGKIDNIRMYSRELGATEIDVLFRLGCNVNCPMPLTFLSFAATKTPNNIALRWTTTHEINTHNFVIQRSIDGNVFMEIGQCLAAGNSIDEKVYHFDDKAPVHGPNYYRIKSVDIDGKSSYTKTILVSQFARNFKIKIYPTITVNNLQIQIYSPVPQRSILHIINSDGRIVQMKVHEIPSGHSSLLVNASTLKNGVYRILIKGSDEDSGTFIKQ